MSQIAQQTVNDEATPADVRLQDDVLSELEWVPDVDEEQIRVTARDGVVTLCGGVTHYAERIAAEQAAKSVHGCKAVTNDIKVDILGPARRSDAEISEAAVNSLRWDIQVPPDKVKVSVWDGWVTLEGTVDWQYQKEAAERCVRYLMGVKSLSNNIAIKPLAKGVDVKSKIEEAFRRNADLEARRITVATFNGGVILAGTVASWAERDDAVAAAWAAPGVTSVDVELKVVP
jgi:osmotically-inducible protein OsmY